MILPISGTVCMKPILNMINNQPSDVTGVRLNTKLYLEDSTNVHYAYIFYTIQLPHIYLLILKQLFNICFILDKSNINYSFQVCHVLTCISYEFVTTFWSIIVSIVSSSCTMSQITNEWFTPNKLITFIILEFSYPYIFATECPGSLIFQSQSMNTKGLYLQVSKFLG